MIDESIDEAFEARALEAIRQEERLTNWSKGSGCGCKIAPAKLAQILNEVPAQAQLPQLLVGRELSDDAAVYQLNEELLLIQTVDFFTPVVDDPGHWGTIAAANALSDVWAMGGRPTMALALLGWPVDELSTTLASSVLSAAQALCQQLGVPLAGGHSIVSSEPIFGLSVTGTCTPSQLRRNSTAQVGDLLFLTKPLGIGMLATAHKRETLSPEGYAELLHWASLPNQAGQHLGQHPYITAITDVTGFGLFGHALEMARGCGHSIHLQWSAVPLLPHALPLAQQWVLPDNALRNHTSYGHQLHAPQPQAFAFGYDPQTNGGLLVAVQPQALAQWQALALQLGLPPCAQQPVGQVVPREELWLTVQD